MSHDVLAYRLRKNANLKQSKEQEGTTEKNIQ